MVGVFFIHKVALNTDLKLLKSSSEDHNLEELVNENRSR